MDSEEEKSFKVPMTKMRVFEPQAASKDFEPQSKAVMRIFEPETKVK
jgi:hypothetical protein